MSTADRACVRPRRAGTTLLSSAPEPATAAASELFLSRIHTHAKSHTLACSLVSFSPFLHGQKPHQLNDMASCGHGLSAHGVVFKSFAWGLLSLFAFWVLQENTDHLSGTVQSVMVFYSQADDNRFTCL